VGGATHVVPTVADFAELILNNRQPKG
jgi:hypothetical protein